MKDDSTRAKRSVQRRRRSPLVASPSIDVSFLSVFFLLALQFQKPTRITIERDGQASNIEVEEGTSILQVRQLLFLFLFRSFEGKDTGGEFLWKLPLLKLEKPERTNSSKLFKKTQAALDAGIELSHDCKMGVCMTCPAKLVRML